MDRTDDTPGECLQAELRKHREDVERFIRKFDKERKNLEDEHGVPE